MHRDVAVLEGWKDAFALSTDDVTDLNALCTSQREPSR